MINGTEKMVRPLIILVDTKLGIIMEQEFSVIHKNSLLGC